MGSRRHFFLWRLRHNTGEMRATGQGADSDLGSKLNAMSDPEELAAHVAAIRTFVFYQQLGLFFTLIEKDVIAAERVFTFNRMNAEILRTTAAKTDNEVAKRGCSLATEALGSGMWYSVEQPCAKPLAPQPQPAVAEMRRRSA
jgi:hypothetical protein